MLVIRLLRVGKKNQPIFRIVVTDRRNPPKSGRFVEMVGFYNPVTKEKSFKQDRIKYWLSVGAQPSDTLHNLLVTEKIIDEKKISVHKRKKPSVDKAMEGKEKKEEVILQKDEAESPKKEEPEKKAEVKSTEPKKEKKEEKPKEPEKPKEKTKEEPKPEKKPKEEAKPKERPKEEIKEKKKEEKSEQK